MWKDNMPEIKQRKRFMSDGDHVQINGETMD